MTKVYFDTSYPIAWTIPHCYITVDGVSVLYVRNAAGAVVEAASLDSTAIEAAALAVSAGNYLGDTTQKYECDVSAITPALPAGNWIFPGWVEKPTALGGFQAVARPEPLYWDGEKEVDVARLQLVILPAVLTVNQSGEVKKVTLGAYQFAKIALQFAVVDEHGDPIDLTGKSLAFTVYSAPDVNRFVLSTEGGHITVANQNQVTIVADETYTEEAGEWRWNLRNMTDKLLLSRGPFIIGAENDAA